MLYLAVTETPGSNAQKTRWKTTGFLWKLSDSSFGYAIFAATRIGGSKFRCAEAITRSTSYRSNGCAITSYPPTFKTSAHSDSSAVRDVTINCGGFARLRKSFKTRRQLQFGTSVLAITTFTGLRSRHCIARFRSRASNNLQPCFLKTSWTKNRSTSYSPTSRAQTSLSRSFTSIRFTLSTVRVPGLGPGVGIDGYISVRFRTFHNRALRPGPGHRTTGLPAG
jgi:hypothetical protein